MSSGRHSRPKPLPAPSTLAFSAAAVTALLVTPATTQVPPTQALEEGKNQVGTLEQATEVTAGESATAQANPVRQIKYQTVASSRARVTRKALKAVAYAKAHLKDQYGWGGTGPRRFDCSGLTMMAWRQAGVRLPHSARMQFRRGKYVPKSRLQPGDLVFFYRAKSHVGIYIGGGRMIHAANPRADIKVDVISRGYYAKRYVGARHIG